MIPHYHTFSNKRRFVDYIKTVHPDSHIMISSTFNERFIAKYTQRKYTFIQHTPNLILKFDIRDGIILNNCRTISVLSIAVAIVMGAERIFIVGMDGYKDINLFHGKDIHFYFEPEETKNIEMLMEKHNWNEILLKQINEYLIERGKNELVILTPTTHKSFYKNIDTFL